MYAYQHVLLLSVNVLIHEVLVVPRFSDDILRSVRDILASHFMVVVWEWNSRIYIDFFRSISITFCSSNCKINQASSRSRVLQVVTGSAFRCILLSFLGPVTYLTDYDYIN